MKPASIISLIVAVFIVVGGIITCNVAQRMADESGQSIFSEIESGEDNTRLFEFGDAKINKILLDLENAEITVIGGAEKSYIEFINFKDNYYSLTSTSSLVSFDETPDITAMLTFWESGFSFKGIRYMLNVNKDDTDHTAKKEVKIHLTGDSTVKQIEINASTCTINVSNIATDTDYFITADNITLNTANLMTSSALNINTGKDIPAAKSVIFNSDLDYITNININAEHLQFTAKSFMCSGNASINCESGYVNLESGGNMKFDLTSETGSIFVNSAPVTSPCTVGTSGGSVNITAKSADINVTTGALTNQTVNN
ncbi:MAG: hypothetical protein E7627_02175 [Ruminococcaceae bacterium]|nr:hypothetical protein [Oscillospiraceae bacterium]